MTEDEARQKWCPAAHTLGYVVGQPGMHGYQPGQPGVVPDGSRCVASVCMAWRWSKSAVAADGTPLSTPVPSTTDGYCGLAGVP